MAARTVEGKRAAAANGQANRRVSGSVRHRRASVADVAGLTNWMAALRRSLG